MGNSLSPQLVYFGVDSQAWDPSKFVIPIEAVSGALFVLVALALVGPGQQLGRALARISNRLEGYTVNIAGSLAGILLFTAGSRWELGPIWWFAVVLAGLAFFWPLRSPRLLGLLALTGRPRSRVLRHASRSGHPAEPPGTGRTSTTESWSPYYRIHHAEEPRFITVNLIGHQRMISRDSPFRLTRCRICSTATPPAAVRAGARHRGWFRQ